VLWWQVAFKPRTDGYEPIDSTTGSAFVWLVVNVIPNPKDQKNPKRFSFYYLFTEITYKFENRSSSHYNPNCLISGETNFQSTCINRAGNKHKKKITSLFKFILNKSYIINLFSTNLLEKNRTSPFINKNTKTFLALKAKENMSVNLRANNSDNIFFFFNSDNTHKNVECPTKGFRYRFCNL